MTEMRSVDVAQYVAPRSLLPTKSAAESVAVTPRQEQRVIVPASTDTHPEQADASTCYHAHFISQSISQTVHLCGAP